MYAGLLPRANPNRLSIHDIANGIGLGEFKRDPGDKHVAHGGFGKLLALRNNVRNILARHRAVITTLLHAYAENLSRFNGWRLVLWVNLDYRIFTLFLFLQDF